MYYLVVIRGRAVDVGHDTAQLTRVDPEVSVNIAPLKDR